MTIRVGKLGIVRLTGKDMVALRNQRFLLDGGCCVRCGRAVSDERPDWHPLKFDLAHVRAKALAGDTIENTRTNCHECHTLSHNAGGHPVPKVEG